MQDDPDHPRHRRIRAIRIARIVLLAALAAVAGFILSLTRMPMPWLIGPMAIAALHSLVAARLGFPVWMRPTGQLVVAAVVGLAFTRPALQAFLAYLPVMILVALATLLAAFAAAAVLVRLSGIDPVSATISSVPGGPVEMSALAETHKVAPAPVALVQTMRIMFLVVTIPPVLVFSSGVVPDARATLATAESDIAGTLLLLVLAMLGAIAFRFLRLTSPFFLGALGVSATATVLTLPVAPPPYWVLCAAQLLLGLSLGNMFDRSLFAGMRRFVLSACVSTTVLVLLTTGIALSVSALSDIPIPTMILATAPGGVTEMALTARLLHQDAALVTAFHIVRVFTIIPFAPLVITGAARFSAWSRRRKQPCKEDLP